MNSRKLNKMIHIIITAYGQPKSTEKAVQYFLDQDIKENYDIIVSDPFEDVKGYITKKFSKHKQVKFIMDEGEGKAYALNILINKFYSNNKNDIFIFTDGDVYVDKNSVMAIIEAFKDPDVGVVCAKPVTINKKDNMLGYWSHLLFDGADKVRSKLSRSNMFFECSGYLFAIRNGVIMEFPIEASEDSIIPFLFYRKGYKIRYVPEAMVYIKNPTNLKEWLAQRKRNIKGHEALSKIVVWKEAPPRTKTFFNEIKEGFFFALFYPRRVKEVLWTFVLFFMRLYVWLSSFYELRVHKKQYKDGWREDEDLNSTEIAD